MQSTSQAIQEMKSSTHLNTQAISKLENQVGQLATQVGEREKGKFPSQPIPNPKGQYIINGSSSSTHAHESVQSITTLRSGKQVDNQMKMPEVEDNENTVLRKKEFTVHRTIIKKRRATQPQFQFRILVLPLIGGLFLKLHSLKV